MKLEIEIPEASVEDELEGWEFSWDFLNEIATELAVKGNIFELEEVECVIKTLLDKANK